MANTRTFVANAPVWVDLSSTDPAASRDYYSKLFGWRVDVSPDPAAGGYAIATTDGKAVAAIVPAQSGGGPSHWMVYFGSDDAEATAKRVEDAGGKVVAPPFDVLKAGRMAAFQDANGAYFSIWQPLEMQGADLMYAPNSVGWVELNARGVDASRPMYTKVFGWEEHTSPMGEGMPPYTEFKLGGQSVAGAMEMNPMVPAGVPNHWLVYFAVGDVDQAFRTATGNGGQGLLEPTDFAGGRFAIVQDPQGAAFGLLKMT